MRAHPRPEQYPGEAGPAKDGSESIVSVLVKRGTTIVYDRNMTPRPRCPSDTTRQPDRRDSGRTSSAISADDKRQPQSFCRKESQPGEGEDLGVKEQGEEIVQVSLEQNPK
ncbi:hypothetical protein Tco_1460172 [Tanacetum coccineum]